MSVLAATGPFHSFTREIEGGKLTVDRIAMYEGEGSDSVRFTYKLKGAVFRATLSNDQLQDLCSDGVTIDPESFLRALNLVPATIKRAECTPPAVIVKWVVPTDCGDRYGFVQVHLPPALAETAPAMAVHAHKTESRPLRAISQVCGGGWLTVDRITTDVSKGNFGDACDSVRFTYGVACDRYSSIIRDKDLPRLYYNGVDLGPENILGELDKANPTLTDFSDIAVIAQWPILLPTGLNGYVRARLDRSEDKPPRNGKPTSLGTRVKALESEMHELRSATAAAIAHSKQLESKLAAWFQQMPAALGIGEAKTTV